MAQHRLTTHPLVIRCVQVARVTDVTPRMRRVTVHGEQLAPFRAGEFDLPGFVNEAFDDHIKLIFSRIGDVPGALPVQRAHSIDWPPSAHREGRDYTPRRWDPSTGELDLDFVMHGDGPAADWARRATPGQDLWFVGPKSSTVIPADVDWFLLAGDESALPAIGHFLDNRPTDAPVRAVIQIAEESARQDLPQRPQDAIEWVTSADRADLEVAVRAQSWLPGRPYVWIAGESRSLIPLRRWVRREKQIPPSHTNITGYWHAKGSGTAGPGRPLPTLAALDPTPWLAARAALELNLLEHLGEDPVDVGVLADRTGAAAPGLATLVRYLDTIGLTRCEGGQVRLGPVGEELVGDEHAGEGFFGQGYQARVLPAMLDLAQALRGERSAWEIAFGTPLAAQMSTDAELFEERMHDAESFAFVARAVVASPVWQRAGRVVLSGPGAIVLARAAEQAGAAGTVQVSTERAPHGVMEPLARTEGLTAVAGQARADLVVSSLEVEHRDDEQVVALLGELEAVADRCLLVEATQRSGPGGTGPGVRHALATHAAAGASPRTAGLMEELARRAGWQVVESTNLGWDYVAIDLRR